jgi:hypothetical protein
MSTTAITSTMATRLSAQPDVSPHWQAPTKMLSHDDSINCRRGDVRSILSSQSTWQSGYVPSIFSDTCASQSGFGNVYHSTTEHVALLLRHQRQWNDLETAKSLTWDAFPWPLLKKAMLRNRGKK